MSRPLRIEYEGAYYHVMNRGLEGKKIALKDQDHEEFVKLLKDVCNRWGVKIFAYCLMSNHYHLFLQTPQGNLSRVMRHLDGIYTQKFNRLYHRDGPLFRGRYRAIVVDSESYLLSLVRYIHLNPVKANLVKLALDYEWSSHRLYLTAKKTESWLAAQEVLNHFKNNKDFDLFVMEGVEKELENFYERKRFSPFLGDKEFVKDVREQVGEMKNGSRQERNPELNKVEDINKYVREKLGLESIDFTKGVRGKGNQLRNLAIYAASKKGGFYNRELLKYFGMTSESSISKVCHRIENQRLKDKKLNALLNKILE